MRRSALSPRGVLPGAPDLASRRRLIAGQRVDRYRFRRRVARRARWVAGRAGIVAVVILALGACGLAGGWLLRSPRFAVAAVEVSGQNRLTRDEIEAAAGIERGSNHCTHDPQRV